MNEIEKILLLIRNLEDENVLMALQLTEGLQLKEAVRQALQPVEFIKAHFSQNAAICFLLMKFFDCKEEVAKSYFGSDLQVFMPHEDKIEWEGNVDDEDVSKILHWIAWLLSLKYGAFTKTKQRFLTSADILRCTSKHHIHQKHKHILYAVYTQPQSITTTSRMVIDTTYIDELKREIDALNLVDKQEIREYCRDMIKYQTSLDWSNTLNFALLNIYRHLNGAKFNYSFESIPEQPEYTIFNLSVNVPY